MHSDIKSPQQKAIQIIQWAKEYKRTELDLRWHDLTEIPSEIIELPWLVSLNVHGNRIKTLPKELILLKELKILDLTVNPISIPPEIVEKTNNPGSIINYYFSLEGMIDTAKKTWGSHCQTT